MSVRFFGQFLIDQGEVDASHVRNALELMAEKNVSIGQLAIEAGIMLPHDVVAVHAEQRSEDAAFGDLAIAKGHMSAAQRIELLKRQRELHLPVGQALVRLGHLESDRLGLLLDAFKVDQAQYRAASRSLPEGLSHVPMAGAALDLLPRFMRRVARMRVRVGEIHAFTSAPEFAEICVSIPFRATRSLEVALVSDMAFAEALAMAVSGLDLSELDPEMVADGVGEFLNVLAGNAVGLVARDGHDVELGSPDYEAELCDGWCVELAVGVGRAALVLSTF